MFGVSSDEYLTYAMQNRKEWELKGQEVVAELIQSVRHMSDPAHRGEEEEESFIPQDLIRRNDDPLPRRMSQSHESLEYTR